MPYFSPVVGSTIAMVAPPTESTSSPLMKFLTVVMWCPFVLLGVGEDLGQNAKAFEEKFVADRQRRQEAQDVAEGAAAGR